MTLTAAQLAAVDGVPTRLIMDEELVATRAERTLLDDFAAYATETRGYVEDAEAGSAFHSTRLRDLLQRHRNIVAVRS